MSKVPIDEVFTGIDQRKKRGDIPSEIRRDLIDKLLAEWKCICGREICEGTEAHQLILEWRNRTAAGAYQDSALDLWRWLGEIRNRYGDFKQEIENELFNHGRFQSDIEGAQRILKEIGDQIGNTEGDRASTLEVQRQQLEGKKLKLEVEAMKLEEDIEELNKSIKTLEAQILREHQQRALVDELSRRALLARNTRTALAEVHETFVSDMRRQIGDTAAQLFAVLLDKEGRENLRRIFVKDDYTLEVEDRWGRPFLANISAGQRQIMSISFIAALAKAAGGINVQMPFFMDTPFGRLSYEHRQNVIMNMPEWCAQWIILATDTEFTRQEARLLAAGNRWGKFYRLKADERGNTVLVCLPVVEVPAFLSERTA